MSNENNGAHFDDEAKAVVIEGITLRDKDIAREAQRWTTGERGPVIDDISALVAADLTTFVSEAVKVGALALSATGQAQESRALERLIKDAGDRATESTAKAAEATDNVVRSASDTVAKAAADAKRAITETDIATRKEFTTAVSAATTSMNAELRRLVGGTNPELLDRLRPVLDKFATELDAKVTTATSELIAKAAKQFDVGDPSSPMAKHAAELDARQLKLTDQITKNHTDLTAKFDELATAVKVQEARAALTKVTPIKGDSYAGSLHTLLSGIATGLGDEYVDTSAVTGRVARSKKGDGVLAVAGGAANLVIEMTDSARVGWAEYLDEAERNRGAAAALGLVRTPEQNGGSTIRVIGARRIVAAFDPDHDDPDLLRTLVMLLRAAALTAAARTGGSQIASAEEKITEAVAQLGKIDDVKKAAGAIQKNAVKIESSCSGIHSGIHRLLAEALAALSEAHNESDMADNGRGAA